MLTTPYLALDIRDHYFPARDPELLQPTKRGCRLKGSGAGEFVSDIMGMISEEWVEAKNLGPCTHDKPEDEDKCKHCNPRVKGCERVK